MYCIPSSVPSKKALVPVRLTKEPIAFLAALLFNVCGVFSRPNIIAFDNLSFTALPADVVTEPTLPNTLAQGIIIK